MKVTGETKSAQAFRQKNRQESNIIIFLLCLFYLRRSILEKYRNIMVCSLKLEMSNVET